MIPVALPGGASTTIRCIVTRALVVFGALALVVVASSSVVAHAQSAPDLARDGDPRLARIDALFADLAGDDEERRRQAYDALTSLGEDMLPAIRARIARVVRNRPERAQAVDLFNRIRRAAGSERADDDVDIAPGVLEVLRHDRSAAMMKMVEPLVLWRALERIGTFEAGRAMYPLLGLDDGVWRHEERRIVDRMGTGIMAAAIAGRNHAERAVRTWASATMRRLGADQPGRAVQGLAPDRLADVLRAYAMLRMQSAMPVIVSFTDSDRRGVRRAARWAIEQYGANAIWALRTEYHAQTGEHAPEHWNARRVAAALYSHCDARRMEPIRRAREAGLAARERGDLNEMRARFDDILAREPDIEDAGPVAEGYAELAAAGGADSAWALRRALRLAPDHARASAWRAELAYLDARHALERGVLDVELARSVLEAVPGHEGAQAMLGSVTESGDPNPQKGRTRWALLAALLFAVAGGALVWRGRTETRASTSDESLVSAFDTNHACPEGDSTLVDSTLPG